jgi:hypothetical protein
MIITNFIAKIIVKIADKLNDYNICGVTIWPFIFIWPPASAQYETLIRHEKKHLEQYKRYWIVGFLPVYLYQFIKYGYRDMPLEIEARLAEIFKHDKGEPEDKITDRR